MSTAHARHLFHSVTSSLFWRSWLLRVVGLGFPVIRGTGLFNTRIGLLPKQAHDPSALLEMRAAMSRCAAHCVLQQRCCDSDVVACCHWHAVFGLIGYPQERGQPCALQRMQ